jgi:hypothetical protein
MRDKTQMGDRLIPGVAKIVEISIVTNLIIAVTGSVARSLRIATRTLRDSPVLR